MKKKNVLYFALGAAAAVGAAIVAKKMIDKKDCYNDDDIWNDDDDFFDDFTFDEDEDEYDSLNIDLMKEVKQNEPVKNSKEEPCKDCNCSTKCEEVKKEAVDEKSSNKEVSVTEEPAKEVKQTRKTKSTKTVSKDVE